jgi:hypothetical protein
LYDVFFKNLLFFMRKNNFHNKITIKTHEFERKRGIEYLHTHPFFSFYKKYWLNTLIFN